MSFTLHSGVRPFFGFDEGGKAFSKSSGAASPRFQMFDAYYSCLLLGLDRGRHGRREDLEAKTFLALGGYPETHRGQAEVIAGLLVDAELRRQDILPDDRDSIEGEMVRLLDFRSATRLSGTGVELLDLYAAAGFDRLHGGMMRPDALEEFLVAYHRLWDEGT